jgi:hypothetical protein
MRRGGRRRKSNVDYEESAEEMKNRRTRIRRGGEV